MRTRSPDKKSRQKLKLGGIQNPETSLEYFQISVNILEARKLTWASSQYANSYVVVMLGKEKHRTGIRKNMAEPCYREFFLFEWYATVREVQCTSLWLAVMEPKCCGTPRLLGESTIELSTIWAQPNHQVFHKWAQLTLPREPEAGAVGFLKVDISIICREDVQVMPMLGSQNTVTGNIGSTLFGAEQQTANYQITIYGAFGLSAGFQNQGDRRIIAKAPSTYVKVSFCGLSAKTAVQFRSYNPSYCEQISIVEAFPNICQLIRLDVCAIESYNKVLGSAEIRLEKISHDGENGFVPTYGPAMLHMYGFPSTSVIGGSVEDGPFYKGALLVALKTVVPYYQTGLRSTSVEPVVPVVMDDLWLWEDFSILCTIFEISMLDKNIIGKHCGVALTVCDLPCSYSESSKEFISLMNGIKSKKLYYTKSICVHKSCPDYGYLDLTSAFPVLQLAIRLPDFRFKIFMNNMVRAIATDLEEALTAIRSNMKNNDNVIFSHLTDELRNAVDNAAEDMRRFLATVDASDQKQNDFKRLSDLDNKQLSLQKDEIEKIFYQITRKLKDSSLINLPSLISNTSSRDSCTITKKEVKSLLAEANYLVLKLRNLVFTSCEGWPDLIVWLLNGTSRVAYCKIPLADAIYSDNPKQSGKLHDRIRTLYLKPLKCAKHFTTLQNSCKCISGKIELLSWMGLYKDIAMFDKVLPCNYKLIEDEMSLSVKAPTTWDEAGGTNGTSRIIMTSYETAKEVSFFVASYENSYETANKKILICRLFIHRAKLNCCLESTRLPCPFVRANTLNAVKETEPQPNTLNPVWNEILKIKCMVSISRQRLKLCTPSILVEVLDFDSTGKHELLGRVEIQAVVDDRISFVHAPKLQWYEMHNESEKTGQILMSAQYLEVPETLIKSTNYASTDASNLSECTQDDVLQEYMSPEILPKSLMPKPNTYKIDIYWWGLRDVSVSKKPCAVLEIDELCIKSDIISERKPNCNFPNGRASHIFEAPLNEAYCPPLKIQLCDSSTFGRTLFMGSKVVKSPHKYMVDWLPKFTRETSIKCASVVSGQFEKVGDNFFVKKHTTSSDLIVPKNDEFDLPQITKKRSFLKSLLCQNQIDEEEFVLLPVFCKQRVYAQLTKTNSSDSKYQDWWLRFFSSLKGRKCENSNLPKMKIYQSELENQPEFFKFKDWCKTFKLYCDNKSGIFENDHNLHCGNMKAGIAIYKWPPPAETEAVNLNGVKLSRGYFDDYPENDPSKFLVRVYIIRGVDVTARSFTGFSDPYVVITCGNKRSENNNRYMTNSSNPVFGKMYEFYCLLPEDYLLTVSLYDHEAISPDDLIGSTLIDVEDRIYSKHKARIYQSELENQPEFFKFKDWCKTFKLYCDNKSGIFENDHNLHCGNMKAGIAIYKWPPPAETEAVNLNGVKLSRGYFDDYPENDPSKFLVRVYIIRGVDVTARSFTGFSDPYVVITCGNKRSENNNRYMTNSSNPVFGKMYEFYCLLPEDYLLTVSLYDHEAISPDDLIGSTLIDVEDRIYSKHKARVGLATEYKASGPSKWRDCVKPSSILEEICHKNNLPPPTYKDNCVLFNDVHYKDIDEKSKTYLSASECKENICLEILHKWHTLPLCGYSLVPEHVETRKLVHPDQPGIDQGKIQMWVDLFPMTAGTYIPLPVDITPRKVEDYELRVVIWSVQGISKTGTEIQRKDIYVKAWIGNEDRTQYTDIHFQSPFGEGKFNWRMIFNFQYQHAEKSVILKEKGPFTEEEEHLPPVLMIHVMDCDAEASKEYLGSVLLDLNSIPRGATVVTDCKLCMLDTAKRVDLFATRSIRGWWPLKKIDINNGNIKLSGVIDLELSLLPKETALLMPVGVGRDPPSPLPEPDRFELQNELKSSSLETVCSRGGVELIVIGVIIVGLLVAFYYKFPFSLIHSMFGIRPNRVFA